MYYICSLKPNRAGVQPIEDPIVCETTLDVEQVISCFNRNYIVLIARGLSLSDMKITSDDVNPKLQDEPYE